MAVFTRVKTWVSNEVLTASDLNGEFNNLLNNTIPASIEDYSSSVSEMQSTTDPGGVGTESQATTLAGEIQRLRFAIKRIVGGAQWYSAPVIDLGSTIGTADIANSAVTADKLANDAVTENKILNGAVTSSKFNDGSITSAKLADTAISGLTNKASPASTDILFISDSSGADLQKVTIPNLFTILADQTPRNASGVGYVKVGPIIINWGFANLGNAHASTAGVTFDLPFTTAALSVVISPTTVGALPDVNSVSFSSLSTTGFTATRFVEGGAVPGGNSPAYYIAIGF